MSGVVVWTENVLLIFLQFSWKIFSNCLLQQLWVKQPEILGENWFFLLLTLTTTNLFGECWTKLTLTSIHLTKSIVLILTEIARGWVKMDRVSCTLAINIISFLCELGTVYGQSSYNSKLFIRLHVDARGDLGPSDTWPSVVQYFKDAEGKQDRYPSCRQRVLPEQGLFSAIVTCSIARLHAPY